MAWGVLGGMATIPLQLLPALITSLAALTARLTQRAHAHRPVPLG